MEYASHEQFRVVYRNNLVEELKRLIEEQEQNLYELGLMLVFKDLIEVERMSICYPTKRCMEELQQGKERLEKIKEDSKYYNNAIKRKYEEIRVLDEKMIPEELQEQLVPIPKRPNHIY